MLLVAAKCAARVFSNSRHLRCSTSENEALLRHWCEERAVARKYQSACKAPRGGGGRTFLGCRAASHRFERAVKSHGVIGAGDLQVGDGAPCHAAVSAATCRRRN